jgi:hypothetical protein
VKVITDLGLSPDFLSSEQLEAGTLDSSPPRVLVLPLSLAVSQKEATALERFAAAGGVVIADAAAGLFDQHVAWRPGGMLAKLLGISAPPSDRRRGGGGISDHRSPRQDGPGASKQERSTASRPRARRSAERWRDTVEAETQTRSSSIALAAASRYLNLLPTRTRSCAPGAAGAPRARGALLTISA